MSHDLIIRDGLIVDIMTLSNNSKDCWMIGMSAPPG